MTIIIPVKHELETGDVIFGLGSDLIYGPWTNPSVMESSKLFSQEDFVWGVTGDISIINIEAIDATTFDEFRSKLKAGVADTIIVVMYNSEVYTFDCNEGKRTWSNATRTGEPLSWGCFATPFNTIFNRYLVHDDCLVFHWISTLHALYGHVSNSERFKAQAKSKCILFSKADLFKIDGQINYTGNHHNEF